jgi:uncharacterized protein YndB with AHSA1/START domain
MEILLEMVVGAPLDRVYAALTEQDEVAAWFTPDVTIEPNVGSIAEFRFDGGRRKIKVEVVTLDPERRVAWKVLEGIDSWESGKGLITWDLSSPFAPERILVHFCHDGWESTGGAFPSTAYRWATFMASLKTYLQTGKGGVPA